MSQLFNTLITQPFAYVLNFILGWAGSYGLALIIFTIFTKLILLPFQVKSKKAMFEQRRLAPKLKALEKKFKDDKTKYNEAVQKLYEDEGVSPLSGCLPTLITLPIIFGLYGVITKPLSNLMHLAAGQITEIATRLALTPASNGTFNEILVAEAMKGKLGMLSDISPNLFTIDFGFLGFNLAQVPSVGHLSVIWLLPIISGVTAFLYVLISQKYAPPMQGGEQTAKMMNFTMPLISVMIGFSMPAGVTLYWIMGNLFMMAQEPLIQIYLSRRFYPDQIEAEKKSKGGKTPK
jgi:YidC/Oxa1 family membrane protein insertase